MSTEANGRDNLTDSLFKTLLLGVHGAPWGADPQPLTTIKDCLVQGEGGRESSTEEVIMSNQDLDGRADSG